VSAVIFTLVLIACGIGALAWAIARWIRSERHYAALLAAPRPPAVPTDHMKAWMDGIMQDIRRLETRSHRTVPLDPVPDYFTFDMALAEMNLADKRRLLRRRRYQEIIRSMPQPRTWRAAA
jgi:hypothetical protein